MSNQPVFVAPWRDLRGDGAAEYQQRVTIGSELHKEIAAGHPLYDQHTEVIARSFASDDIIVRLSANRWAQVHLTWKGAAETPPWPITTFYDTIEALEQDLA